MNTYARKAWQIIAYTWNGAAYCEPCAPHPESVGEYGDTPAPVFVSDEFYMIDPDTGEHTPHTCDTCHAPIK
jgi:hypothetical protein